jgi:hypothetical protein
MISRQLIDFKIFSVLLAEYRHRKQDVFLELNL